MQALGDTTVLPGFFILFFTMSLYLVLGAVAFFSFAFFLHNFEQEEKEKTELQK